MTFYKLKLETLDLHGVRHHAVDRIVENYVLLKPLPVRIITGVGGSMQSLVIEVLDRHKLTYRYENFWNLGSLIVSDES